MAAATVAMETVLMSVAAMTRSDSNINGDSDCGSDDDSNSGGGCGNDDNDGGSGGHSEGGGLRQQSTQSGSRRNGGDGNGVGDSNSNQFKATAKEMVKAVMATVSAMASAMVAAGRNTVSSSTTTVLARLLYPNALVRMLT